MNQYLNINCLKCEHKFQKDFILLPFLSLLLLLLPRLSMSQLENEEYRRVHFVLSSYIHGVSYLINKDKQLAITQSKSIPKWWGYQHGYRWYMHRYLAESWYWPIRSGCLNRRKFVTISYGKGSGVANSFMFALPSVCIYGCESFVLAGLWACV